VGPIQETPIGAIGEDIVHVSHRVSLTDAHYVTPVRRHYSMEDLAQLPAALELRRNADGTIVVSPAKSATDDTEVRVESNMQAMYMKMENHVRQMIEEQYTQVEARVEDRFNEVKRDMGHLHRAWAIRNIEDWAVKWMKSKLDMKDEKITHTKVVEAFLTDFRFGGVTTPDLKSLCGSTERELANDIIHISYPDDIDTLRTAWKYLRPVLSDEDMHRYERLFKFGIGESPIQRK
jgi:hypothetical protein